MTGLSTTARRARRRGRAATALVVVCLAVAVLALTWFVARAVARERRTAWAQLLEAAATLANDIGPQLQRQWVAWENRIPRAAGLPDGRLEMLSAIDPAVADAIARGGVVVRIRGDQIAWYPRGHLLYAPDGFQGGARADAGPWPPAMLRAEAAEVRRKDYAAAAAGYRALFNDHDDRVRSEAQLRLARTLRKDGRLADALRIYEQVIRARRRDNGIDMAAAAVDRCAVLEEMKQSVEGCALEVFDGLVSGKWQLDGARYQFYSQRVRAWLAPVLERTDVGTRRWAEGRGLETTVLAHQAMDQWLAAERAAAAGAGPPGGPERTGHMLLDAGDTAGVALWRAESEPGTATLLVIPPSAAMEGLWRPVVGNVKPGCYVSLTAGSREVATSYGGAATRSTASVLATNRMEDGPTPWRIVVWWDAESLSREWWSRTRQYVDWSALALMLAAVGMASALMARSVRRERAVARMKSEFVSTVSHEFRTPLSAISHLAELLDAGRVTDEARKQEYYGLIVGESARLSRLVENLLDFARIEEGRAQYELVPTAIGDWLPGVVEEFGLSRAAGGKRIDVSIADGLPVVRLDARALATAIVNLLDNAAKYAPASDVVWVEARPGGEGLGGVRVLVRDAGPGIPADELPRLWERFYRGSASGSAPGTGLGLALVKRIVEAHGGSVGVESREGDGSTFVIWLPQQELVDRR